MSSITNLICLLICYFSLHFNEQNTTITTIELHLRVFLLPSMNPFKTPKIQSVCLVKVEDLFVFGLV